MDGGTENQDLRRQAKALGVRLLPGLRALTRVRTTPQARTLEPSLGGSVAAGLVHLGIYFSEEESKGPRLVWVSAGTATSLATVTGRLEAVFCWTPVTSPWTLWAQDPCLSWDTHDLLRKCLQAVGEVGSPSRCPSHPPPPPPLGSLE